MEDFVNKAVNTAERPPRIWKSYVDETFVALKNQFCRPMIQFAVEEIRADWSMPFLDILVMP